MASEFKVLDNYVLDEIPADVTFETKMGDLGLHNARFNKHIDIKLVTVICDAPGYSDVRYTVNPNGKVGCDRCVVVGRHLEGRMIFKR